MENNIEIKIVIKPTEVKGFAMFIIEPKDKIMSPEIMSCYTLARGMVKFGLETPDIAFDYGMSSFQEEENTFKYNGGKHKGLKREGNILDITDIIKNRKK